MSSSLRSESKATSARSMMCSTRASRAPGSLIRRDDPWGHGLDPEGLRRFGIDEGRQRRTASDVTPGCQDRRGFRCNPDPADARHRPDEKLTTSRPPVPMFSLLPFAPPGHGDRIRHALGATHSQPAPSGRQTPHLLSNRKARMPVLTPYGSVTAAGHAATGHRKPPRRLPSWNRGGIPPPVGSDFLSRAPGSVSGYG